LTERLVTKSGFLVMFLFLVDISLMMSLETILKQCHVDNVDSNHGKFGTRSVIENLTSQSGCGVN